MHTSFPYVNRAAAPGGRFPLDGVWMSERDQQAGSELLDAQTFAAIAAAAPLVTIDLLVEDGEGHLLLGLRRNPPARGCWFVPGGRIRKGETLDAAFARLTFDELGQAFERRQARFDGVYEHFFDTNFRGTAGETTHHIVHAYRLRVDPQALRLPAEQHSRYSWVESSEAGEHPDIHPYVLAYFQSSHVHPG